MNAYYLKDKLNVTDELLDDLLTKGWQEIEYLQGQIANIETKPENEPLVQLLKNLLTSYYVFTGNLESISDTKLELDLTDSGILDLSDSLESDNNNQAEINDLKSIDNFDSDTVAETSSFEPFEYFVDFDEPIGLPLTDTDLYNC